MGVDRKLAARRSPREFGDEYQGISCKDSLNDTGKKDTDGRNHGINVEIWQLCRIDGWHKIDRIPDPIGTVEAGEAKARLDKGKAT
jgi:hypothetical protein